MKVFWSTFIATLWIGCASLAAQTASPSIEVSHAWTRATAGAAQTGAVYMTLKNVGKASDQLVSVSSPVAGMAELHATMKEGDVMKMQASPPIELKPDVAAELKPGGLHVMLMHLKSPLRQGEKIPVTLTFAAAPSITLEVPVRGPGALSDTD